MLKILHNMKYLLAPSLILVAFAGVLIGGVFAWTGVVLLFVGIFIDTAIKKQGDLLAINEKLVDTLDKIEKRVEKSNENTVGELQLITNTLINELSKNSKISIENNKKLIADLSKLNRSNSKTISKAIQQISNKAIYKQIVANQAIQAQQISKLVKQNNNVLGKIADKTSRIKYP